MNNNKIFDLLFENFKIMNEMYMHCEADHITYADYSEFADNTLRIVREVGGETEVDKIRKAICGHTTEGSR